MLMFATFSVH